MVAGFDIGQRRIGVAVAEEQIRIAIPRSVIHVARDSPRKTIFDTVARAVIALQQEDRISEVVVGWPKTARGGSTVMSRLCEQVKCYLEKQFPLLKIVLWDESYSSAHARLLRREVGKKGEMVDAYAAAHILQTYLDSNHETRG